MLVQTEKTHQGLFDLSYLTHLPNITILAPSNESEFSQMLEYALKLSSPVAIRYPKSGTSNINTSTFDGKWNVLKEGNDLTVLAVGPRMIELAFKLSEKIDNLRIVNARTIKPLDLDFIKSCGDVITLEENSEIGGFGAYLSQYISSNGINKKVLSFGAKDNVTPHGSIEYQLKLNNLTVEELLKKLKEQSFI